ncbi:MAG: energy-coupling factor ABC transporter ATP-binding protein [Treponema sp.]|nr:energy-coupling factor ABC transporter ATP-binding protein [Treponema sp.]
MRNLSLDLKAGECAALIGANGAGKTSLLLALAGILPLQSGSITLGASELDSGVRPGTGLRRRIGLVFQNPEDQLFTASIWEDLLFGPRNMGLGEAEAARRAEAVLAKLGIGFLRDRSPLKLSGGEKRLAAMAAVLTMEPELLLFDEPTAFLDPRARRDLAALITDLPQAKIVATHDTVFAEELCSWIFLLKNGELAAQGETRSLLADRELMEKVFYR